MSKHLQKHLEANPQIETVYHNGKGEWQFHKRPGFEHEIPASEVIEDGLPGHEDDDHELTATIDTAGLESVLKLAQSKVEDAETEAELAKEEAENAKAESKKALADLAKLKAELAALKVEKPAKKASESDNQNTNA